MAKAKKTPALVGGSPDDTEANFYEAMQTGDLERLMACWADDDEVFCIQPGGPRLLGLAAVRAAFEQVFNGGGVRIQIEGVRKIESITCAVHSVRECIDMLTSEGLLTAYATATNVYQKTAKGWRMVAHHASPGGLVEARDVSEVNPVLH